MLGAPQLVVSGRLDYLVFDYLARTTMAILAAARIRKPETGYATDFVDIAMKAVLPEVMRQRIKVVAMRAASTRRAAPKRFAHWPPGWGWRRIAVVLGDDVSAQMPALRAAGTCDMFHGEPVPEKALSANAYLGALPVARALAAGADTVITGRAVDSAATLGPLMHEFNWSAVDFDQLAGGSLAPTSRR